MTTTTILIITSSATLVIAGVSVTLWAFRKRLRKHPGNRPPRED